MTWEPFGRSGELLRIVGGGMKAGRVRVPPESYVGVCDTCKEPQMLLLEGVCSWCGSWSIARG